MSAETLRPAGDSHKRGLAAGADGYLVKPFKYTELAEEIERLTR